MGVIGCFDSVIMEIRSMSQKWSPSDYAANARFVSDLGLGVLDLLAPQPGERILDLGCGDGALTAELERRCAVVVGVDSSPEMIEAAKGHGLDVHLMSGEALRFTGEFDAIFTNAALHWMPAVDSVIAGVKRALKPGGRFVGEFGGHGNLAAITVALRAALRSRGIDALEFSPWFYPTDLEYRERLEAHGFTVDWIALIPRPTPLATGMRGWLETFGNPYFALCEPEEVPELIEEVIGLLATSLRDSRGAWTADYVRLRFAAHLA